MATETNAFGAKSGGCCSGCTDHADIPAELALELHNGESSAGAGVGVGGA